MLEGSNSIRFASMDDMFRAARAEITVWSAADAGIEDQTRCGLRGSPTVVRKVFAPKPRQEKAKLIDTAGLGVAEAAPRIIDTLLAADRKLADHLAVAPLAG
jgi:electron transfer flavoprotein beta subunit